MTKERTISELEWLTMHKSADMYQEAMKRVRHLEAALHASHAALHNAADELARMEKSLREAAHSAIRVADPPVRLAPSDPTN